MKWEQSSFDLFTHCTNNNYLTYETKGTEASIDVINWVTPLPPSLCTVKNSFLMKLIYAG